MPPPTLLSPLVPRCIAERFIILATLAGECSEKAQPSTGAEETLPGAIPSTSSRAVAGDLIRDRRTPNPLEDQYAMA
jgi:hypothetical protein